MAGILDGIRVLDFGRYIAGPWCGALLGDLGAEVIRIERREGSEDRFLCRLNPESPLEQAAGAQFMQMNRNKLGLTLDPMSPKGREVVRRLVATADVVLANLPPATLKSMGLDYDTLRAIKPDIVLTMVSAFGEGGPYSERVGFDGIGQVMCGSTYLSGTPEQPVKTYVPWVDFGTATLAALGTVGALMHRARTGEGQIVEAALFQTALAFFNYVVLEQAVTQINRQATLNRSPYAGPVDLYRTKDGWIIVQVIGNPLFKRWAKLLGEEDQWLNDPRFKDDLARGEHGQIISERMARWCAERTSAEALGALEAARVPAGPMMTPQEVLADPHVKAMNFLQWTAYPGLKSEAPLTTTPVRLSKTPGTIRRRPPLLGEHTDALLQSLGYGAGEIEALRADGVV